MLQLPPDSHCAIASQFTLDACAGDAGPSRAAVPATPAAVRPSARRACLPTREVRACLWICAMTDKPPRLRSQLSGSDGVCPAAYVRLHPEARELRAEEHVGP